MTLCLVTSQLPGDRCRAGRTVRGLRQAGVAAEAVHDASGLAARLGAAPGGVWLVGAGAWPAHPARVRFPTPSARGLPLCAVGIVRPEADGTPSEEAARWAALQAQTGGDFAPVQERGDPLPPIVSAYLDPVAAGQLAHRLVREGGLDAALGALCRDGPLRVVHFPPLDVHYDRGLRVVQVVTTLQRGGAERVALDLARELPRHGIRSRLVALGRPTRAPFPAAPGTIDLSGMAGDRRARLQAAADAAGAFAADLVHGHLLNREDVAPFAARGLPLLLTVHNTRPGWPVGLETFRSGDAALLVACAQAVEADLRAARIPLPIRTVWNGIDFAPFEAAPAQVAAARDLRQRLGLAADDFVLVAIANPRPQKRLDLLPGVLAATQRELARRGSGRRAQLLIAGEPSCAGEEAIRAHEALRAGITLHGLGDSVHLLGAVDDVAVLLAAANVLVSCSAYEGLSLAHLEALAAGLPVVATDAGGTREIAAVTATVFVLPLDAGPEQFARVLADLAGRGPDGSRAAVEIHFSRHRMAEGYTRLYPRAIEAARGRRRGDGLLLVCNNFSTGGAQSSARRLLLGLVEQGVRVRAAVLEEHPDHPTPGRRSLTAAEVPVRVLPPAGTNDPALAVAELLEQIDADPPAAVLFWNAIQEHKVLLADGLLDVPIFDVSPGEMYFTSLERYFRRPRPGLPYRCGHDYGRRLAGAIVKYQAEVERAAAALGTAVHVIPNGVPLDGWLPRDGRPPGDRLVIGTAARISPQKKLDELLQALRRANGRLPAHVLRIAGGVERGSEDHALELRRLAEGLPVEWVGELEDVRPFLRELDLFVMISEPAGCPNASLEAMAEGLPIVATDVGGAAEQVADGVTGRFVPRGDTAALADAMTDLAADAARRARWGAAARARAEDRFDVRRMVADYRRVCGI